MTTQELLNTIKSLPSGQQFELANSILDELARAGQLPVSDELKQLLDSRIKEADEEPDSLILAKEVFDELAGDG